MHALTWFHSSLIEHTCNHLPPPFISSLTSVTHRLVLRLQLPTLVDVCLSARLSWSGPCLRKRKFTNSWNILRCHCYVGSPALVIVNKLPFDLHPPVCLLWPVPWQSHRGTYFYETGWYFLSPYTNPIPKPTPHRTLSAFLLSQKNSFCMIYKPFEIWGHAVMSLEIIFYV